MPQRPRRMPCRPRRVVAAAAVAVAVAPVAARVAAAAAPAVEVAVIAALADMRKPRIRTGPPPATTTSGWRWLSSQFPPRRPAASDPGRYRDVFSEISARHPLRTASPCRQGVEKAGQLCLIRRKRAVLLSRWLSAIDARRSIPSEPRRSSLRFGRNTLGIPPSRALSAGRLAGLGALVTLSTGC